MPRREIDSRTSSSAACPPFMQPPGDGATLRRLFFVWNVRDVRATRDVRVTGQPEGHPDV